MAGTQKVRGRVQGETEKQAETGLCKPSQTCYGFSWFHSEMACPHLCFENMAMLVREGVGLVQFGSL